MLRDIVIVVWKEWKEFIGQRSTLLSVLVFMGLFAVILPYQRGADWIDSPVGVANLLFMPLFFVLTVIADAFAGERERHTLDTLLASRLPDGAILFGKLAAAVAYGWGLTLAALAAALLVANLAAGGGFGFYPPSLGIGAVSLSLLSLVLVSAAGILVSLRASTVREAQVALNIGLLAVGVIATGALVVIPPAWRETLRDFLADTSAVGLLLLAGALLAAIDAALIAAAMARFRRSRLVLD